MNLFDILGPIAIAGGIGVSYGATQIHGVPSWLGLATGALAGWYTFLAMRRATLHIQRRNPERLERFLSLMYFSTFVAILVATIFSAWIVRFVLSRI